ARRRRDPTAEDRRRDDELRLPRAASVGGVQQEAAALADVAEAVDDEVALGLRRERHPVSALGADAEEARPLLAGVGRLPEGAALLLEVAVLGVDEIDERRAAGLVQRGPRLAAVGRAQQVAPAGGEQRAPGAIDRRELGLDDVVVADRRERIAA